MRRLELLISFVLCVVPMAAQQQSDIERIMRLKGADSPEEMDPYEVERLEDILKNPLKLNHLSASRMVESGLFSHYQAVSLVDYRSRHGDVLSLPELAAVDGFGKAFTELIAPFVSLESARMPGHPGDGWQIRNELTARAGVKVSMQEDVPEETWNYGLKYKLEAGESLSAGLALSRSYNADGLRPDSFSGHARWDFRRREGKFIAGDFNARFGQGLALWNGLGISGLSAPSSYMKRTSGISSSSSFTGNYAFHGLAADLMIRSLKVSAFVAVNGDDEKCGLLPAVNLAWYGRNGQAGLTHYADFAGFPEALFIPDMKTSADICFCFEGVDIFAECAYDWISTSAAALAGLTFPAGEKLRLASMLRYYPSEYSPSRSSAARSTAKCSNEYAFSFSGETPSGTFSLDAAYFPEPKSVSGVHDLQFKMQSEWTFSFSEAFKTKLRIQERVRSWGENFRTDLRADFVYTIGRPVLALRLNVVNSKGTGFLGYLESGYKDAALAFYARGGIFLIDDWEDRIYAYERDAPGSFSVPAYYGRGLWAAFTASWRFSGWGKVYARAAYTGYPFMEQKKPGKAELKLQCVFVF